MPFSFDVLGETLDPVKLLEITGWEDASVSLNVSSNWPDNPSKKTLVSIEVGEADYSDFKGQVAEAIDFLTTHRSLVSLINNLPGVEYARIVIRMDLYIPLYDRILNKSFEFPGELMAIVGELGLVLDLRLYPDEGGDDDDDGEEEELAEAF